MQDNRTICKSGKSNPSDGHSNLMSFHKGLGFGVLFCKSLQNKKINLTKKKLFFSC